MENGNAMHEILECAAGTGASVRLLRLACKRKFREEVIRATDSGAPTPAVRLLQDPRLQRIEMILSNPFSVSFLERMDDEKKDNEGICRIRGDVLSFAKGILRVNLFRESMGLPPIRLSFHSEPLIWNICIVGDQSMTVRAYYGHHSGHDGSIQDEILMVGQPSRLAESFLSYYEAVSRAERTKTIHTEFDLETLGAWPSLFKGNSISTSGGEGKFTCAKVLESKEARDAEDAWLTSGELMLGRAGLFRPRPIAFVANPAQPSLWQSSEVSWMNGCTADTFLRQLQQIAAESGDEHTAKKASQAAALIIQQAMDALRGFHSAWKELQLPPVSGAIVDAAYPWERKIVQAIHDSARCHAIPDSEERNCLEQLKPLLHQLTSSDTVNRPFRDAHLKNRFIALDSKHGVPIKKGIIHLLQSTSLRELEQYLAEKTWDFDFESTCHCTNEWDDPLHILWCSHIGFQGGLGFEQLAPETILRMWWRMPASTAELTTLRRTLLCRSLREFCRRMWYLGVMPQTYHRRYGEERTGRFATIALETARKLHLDAVAKFVTTLGERLASLMPQSGNLLPLLDIQQPNQQAEGVRKKTIFISYSRADSKIVDRMEVTLVAKGYECIVDRSEIIQGNFKGLIVDAVDRASLVVVLLTENSIRSNWVPPEVTIAHDRKRSVLPVYWEKIVNLRDASGGLYFDIIGKNLHHEILSDSHWEDCISKIARACDGAHAKLTLDT